MKGTRNPTHLLKQLQAGIQALGLSIDQIDQTAEGKLVSYIELLSKWNAVYNLTAVRSPEEMVTRHLLDSLVLCRFFPRKPATELPSEPPRESPGESPREPLSEPPGELDKELPRALHKEFPMRVLDVGTGPGLPGLVLAICNPNAEFVLLDSQQKKINFVQQAILSLNVSNATPICERVERYQPAHRFDWIISRAFSSLRDFVEKTAHLADEQTRWVAMKGKISAEELAALPKNYTIEDCLPVEVPGLSAYRCLVFVKRRL